MGIHRSSSGDEFILEKHELQQQCFEGKKREEKLKQCTSTTTSPPPSSSSSTSSPSHEFSFTISLHRPSPSFAIDLSPADDIFFHGHLLPLHLISHCSSISPRSSTTSSDTIGLPIRELFDVDVKKKLPSSTSNIAPSARGSGSPVCVARVRSKPKYSFSLFRKWRRRSKSSAGDRHKEEDERKKKENARFDVGRVLRRYLRVVRPLFLFGGEKEDKSIDLRWRPHSFSGNYSISRLKEWGERRRRRSSGGGGQFSAPASMRTSPTNSGLLVATATISSNDSTMEELQNAIQAAIAHCKNSSMLPRKTTSASSEN